MSVADVAKAAGVEWGKLSDKTEWEKKVCSKLSIKFTNFQAEDDKKRYERENAAYKRTQ